ncbi:hypothetical protein GNI_162120, partial [Gregarina niphandrodes]
LTPGLQVFKDRIPPPNIRDANGQQVPIPPQLPAPIFIGLPQLDRALGFQDPSEP